MSERIGEQARATLFMASLARAQIDSSFRCTGLDDDKLCPDTSARDSGDCVGCEAMGITELRLMDKETYSIAWKSKGVIKKVKRLG